MRNHLHHLAFLGLLLIAVLLLRADVLAPLGRGGIAAVFVVIVGGYLAWHWSLRPKPPRISRA